MRVPSGLKTRSQVNPMARAEVAVCLPESGSYTVNTHFLGSAQHTASREPSGLTAARLTIAPGGPFSWVWTRPSSSRRFTMFVVVSGDCARAGLRATFSPSLATSLSPCRVGSGGQ